MKDRKLATRYARALLSLLDDPAQAESADEFLDALARLIQDSSRARDLLLDPAISATHRERALRELASQHGQPRVVQHFLAVVVSHHRVASLPSIAAVFHEEREQAAGIVAAEITTAGPLDEAQRDRARAALERVTGRKVRLSCKVEPRVLGGAITRLASMVYDGSLRTQLDELRERMTQEQ